MNGLHFFFGLGAFLSPFLVAQVVGIAGGYRLAYWILAAFATLVGVVMLTMAGSPQPIEKRSNETNQTARGSIPYALVISAMLFLFFYVGAEITFGGWVYTYAVTLGLTSAAGAAYLTSAFWLAFTIGRLISIPAATRFTPKQVIPAALFMLPGRSGRGNPLCRFQHSPVDDGDRAGFLHGAHLADRFHHGRAIHSHDRQ